MPKHVYPPWHGLVQKILFVIAVILCIALPVIYGQKSEDDNGDEEDMISSTTLIVVLVLYFVFWAVFSLIVRFALKSYRVESTLPVHTPTPAPPLLLHSPTTDRNAMPAAPAIKNAQQYHSTTEQEVMDKDESQDPFGIESNLELDRVATAGSKPSRINKTRLRFADDSVEGSNRDDEGDGQDRIYPQQKSLRFMDQDFIEQKQLPQQQQQYHRHFHHQYPPSPRTPPSSPLILDPSTPSFTPHSPMRSALSRKGAGANTSDGESHNGNGATAPSSPSVSFQTRPTGLAGESIVIGGGGGGREGRAAGNSSYPTFATYRQAQHASFDAFAQRIRRALQTANEQRQIMIQQEQEEQEAEQARRLKEKEMEEAQKADHRSVSGSGIEVEGLLAVPNVLSPPTVKSVVKQEASASGNSTGRPRSSSTASKISNLSEKIRLGTTFFGRAGRSRAGSDASVVPSATSPSSYTTAVDTCGGAQNAPVPVSSSSPTSGVSGDGVSSSTTTMAAIASAAAVASAMSIPRSSVYSTTTENDNLQNVEIFSSVDEKKTGPMTRRTKQHSGISHPLSQTQHINDKSLDNTVNEMDKVEAAVMVLDMAVTNAAPDHKEKDARHLNSEGSAIQR
ncbi:hypothetical protein EDD11_005153 [Mortierella claussenii]|nr:hypothetical protein EDD11_005153 [Mortierella claussenii]